MPRDAIDGNMWAANSRRQLVSNHGRVHMSACQTVFLSFGGNAALLAVLVLLSKSLLEKILVRDTKLFETKLKARADAEIERLKSEMSCSLESYKMQLRKSEYFFQREYAAALDFTSLARSILPRPARPDMDWWDAMDQVIETFGDIVTCLDNSSEPTLQR